MPEQLSQSQIDALLKKMASGGEDVQEEKQKIKEYDFKSPKKFTKEQLKAMDGLYETFSRMLASYFSGLLRTVCEITVVQIEEQRYYEYNNALPDTALVGLVEMRPENKRYEGSTFIMDMSTSLGFYFIDKVLGGPGTGFNLSRDYTDIEITILGNIIGKITERLQETWQNNLPIEAKLAEIQTNARLLQIFAPEDVVLIVILNVKLGNQVEGNLNICMPAEFLESVMHTFSLRYARPAKHQDRDKEEQKKRIILENVCESDMELRVIFDRFQLELRDIMSLQPDDVIPLAKRVDSDVLITVDQIPWFTAKLGQTKQKKAVRLNDIVNGDEVI
ncbi:MAG: flagellar motor switch protein FliM [Angelakisella sp.]|nr:flagellar motor switch protein FliM [Angelakisella sp.]